MKSAPANTDSPQVQLTRELERLAAEDPRRPLKVRVRVEVYNHKTRRYHHVKGSCIAFGLQGWYALFAQRIWETVNACKTGGL